VITRPQLTRRISLAARWTSVADGRVDGTTDHLAQLHRANLDLRHIDTNHTIAKAWAHIHDHLPGYPTTSMPSRGSGGTVSNRTLDLAIPDDGHLDPVRRDIDELLHHLDQTTTLTQLILQHRDTRTVDTGITNDHGATIPATVLIEASARRARFLLLRWAQEPEVRWCTSCERHGGHRQPIDASRFGDVCRWCGEFRRTNKQLPPIEILRYHHTGERIPQRVLDRFHVKLPKRKKATT
jgi:hypothetical protein